MAQPEDAAAQALRLAMHDSSDEEEIESAAQAAEDPSIRVETLAAADAAVRDAPPSPLASPKLANMLLSSVAQANRPHSAHASLCPPRCCNSCAQGASAVASGAAAIRSHTLNGAAALGQHTLNGLRSRAPTAAHR
jgi:hypothetical protein